MARTPTVKNLINTNLACSYGGWVYCDHCSTNIGYLCYVTYDSFRFEYKCKCGESGSMYICFGEDKPKGSSEKELVTVKHRLCCPEDLSPLFTVLDKKLESYKYDVVCNKCGARYTGVMTP